ncbi:hypothetical protein [Azospirillum sp.]|uniref:hypothetical protein n=1 Tax=Azospirillum sp. TaxID=34012 RepID=UPI002D6FFAED|nr:hypothetical protein [Azospirillum sp.]HYD65681.1 hypothetical protein [Azospirillum sp.]
MARTIPTADEADCWVPDPERLAKETADLLRFGTRVLAGLAVTVAGTLGGLAVWFAV